VAEQSDRITARYLNRFEGICEFQNTSFQPEGAKQQAVEEVIQTPPNQ
jgi:hypothetical protein